ncbi:MAG TPA: DUF4271 domain-containing protein, partial [Chitinophagales bacterium]|nr:DUF4271 domain-containing protein [Chitinophagales bacterium]
MLTAKGRVFENDIEQLNSKGRNGAVFILMMVMLGTLTYLKTAFNKDIEEIVQSVLNRNLAQQIFRMQSKEVTFSSFVLNANFIVTISLYARFIFVKYFHISTLENLSAILLLIFLFTFFYLIKLGALKLLGLMFEAKDVCNEYIFNFTTICKTLGLALLPALFIFYTSQQRVFDFVFAITAIVVLAHVLVFAWRGLSTGYKLMYRSVYHFFIYV